MAIPAVALRARQAKLLVWIFNIEGTLDLINAIALATIYNAAPFMGPAYWIPAFWVPALLVTHYVTFILLLGPGRTLNETHWRWLALGQPAVPGLCPWLGRDCTLGSEAKQKGVAIGRIS